MRAGSERSGDGTDPTIDSGMVSSIRKYAARFVGGSNQAPTALLVDDEDAVLKFVERVMSGAGYRTYTALSGPEALELATRIDPLDLLVTDVMMPRMTGDELARRLRQTLPSLKVLYLTGYSDQLFKEKTTLWAEEAFLDKPCTVNGLREAVSLLLYGRLDSPSGTTA